MIKWGYFVDKAWNHRHSIQFESVIFHQSGNVESFESALLIAQLDFELNRTITFSTQSIH